MSNALDATRGGLRFNYLEYRKARAALAPFLKETDDCGPESMLLALLDCACCLSVAADIDSGTVLRALQACLDDAHERFLPLYQEAVRKAGANSG